MAFIPVSPVISSQGRTLKNGVSSLIGELPAPVFSRPEPLKEGRSMDLFWAAKTENSSFLQHILQCPRPGVSSKPKQELLELGGKAKNALAINLVRFQYRSSDSVWMVKELHSILFSSSAFFRSRTPRPGTPSTCAPSSCISATPWTWNPGLRTT